MRPCRLICSWNATAMSRQNAIVWTPFSRKLSPRRKTICCRSQAARCALLAAIASVRRRCRCVFPRARSRRTIARRRTSLARKDGPRANFVRYRVCGARARACARESCAQTDPRCFRTGTFIIYDIHPFPAPCALSRGDSHPNTGTYRRCGTYRG